MSDLLEETKISIPKHLALRLSSWHGSMGDPIYAVSSTGYAGYPIPISVFRRALDGIDSLRGHPDTSENHEDLEDLYFAMKSQLGEEGDGLEETITRAMARTIWAIAWADENDRRVEEEDAKSEYGSGDQLVHVAPDTPKRVHEHCQKVLRETLEKHQLGLTDFVAAHKEEGMTVHDFGHEVAMASHGIGGELPFDDIDFAYNETYYEQFAYGWISND
jgi:hypothetical protein